MGVLFLAGIYGVGKSTLGETLSQRQGIPFYSAGDLISQVNGEIYGANKVVADKVGNQDILAIQIDRLLKQYDRILLAGHFCIVNKHGEVDCLPQEAFKNLHLDKIILLEAEEEQVLPSSCAGCKKIFSGTGCSPYANGTRNGIRSIRRTELPYCNSLHDLFSNGCTNN